MRRWFPEQSSVSIRYAECADQKYFKDHFIITPMSQPLSLKPFAFSKLNKNPQVWEIIVCLAFISMIIALSLSIFKAHFEKSYFLGNMIFIVLLGLFLYWFIKRQKIRKKFQNFIREN